MKRFLIKSVLLVLPVLVVLILVNYFGDAANIFNREYEKKIAEIIANGKNVTNISNYDERLLQEEIIFNLKYTPDIAIIGSSRAMQIDKNFFPGLKLMNNSVSGASLEDLIAIYQLYKSTNNLPKKIVLGIDPWTFQVDNNRTRWKSIGKYYYRFNDKEKQDLDLPINQLISLSYFQNSLPTLYSKMIGNNNPLATATKANSTLTKLGDGSIIYGAERRNISQEEVEQSSQIWVSDGMIKRYQNFQSLEPKWNQFEALITDMKKEDIEIVFVLTPFYPFVYTEMITKFPIIKELEEEILKFAEKANIPLYGSFNPEKYNLSEDEFSDETHPKEVAMRKIFREKIN